MFLYRDSFSNIYIFKIENKYGTFYLVMLIQMYITSEMVGTADAGYIPKLNILNSFYNELTYNNTLYYTSDRPYVTLLENSLYGCY